MKRKIVIEALGDTITIEQKKTDSIGHTDGLNIVIDPDQPKVGKHVTLIHELLHVVDDQMIGIGYTKRRISHHWIKGAAINLLALLVYSGVYKGVSEKEFAEFINSISKKGRSPKETR
jgi:hypothetical protein